jgi:GH18 family chitinase
VALGTFESKGRAENVEQNHNEHHAKILAGYFEEWSIYYAGYNVANLQQNGVADKLTHLIYAFANVTAPAGDMPGGCGIADAWADYQSPYLPSVNGNPYTGPLYGNFAALLQLKGLHPEPEGAHFPRRCICPQYGKLCDGCTNASRPQGARLLLHRHVY